MKHLFSVLEKKIIFFLNILTIVNFLELQKYTSLWLFYDNVENTINLTQAWYGQLTFVTIGLITSYKLCYG